MAYELYYWGACGDFYGRALSPLLIFEESGASPRLRDAIDAASGLLMSRRWRRILARVRGVDRTADRADVAPSPQTKAVAALKGKGKKLMPGEHNKAW